MTPSRAEIAIRVVGPDEWAAWRELRLAALAESPDAFSARLSDWQGPSDSERRWRERLTGPWHNVIADLDARPVGMASGWLPDRGPAELMSMWVDPAARGQGVGDVLVESVVAWATRQRPGEVVLRVRTVNRAASALYARHGFVESGLVATGPGEPAERWMVRMPE